MTNRIMQVYFGNNCFPYKDKERKVAYPIVAKVGGGSLVCGENNTTTIRFYTTRIGGLSNTWIANLKMPNGRKYNRILETTGVEEDEFYVDLDISDLYTQIQGEVIIGLNGFEGEMSITEEDDQYIINGTPSIVSTYVIKVMVNYAPLFLPIGDIEPDIVQQILALIATKLNITTGIVVIGEDTDLSQFESGQVLFDKETGKLYTYNGTTLVELELDLLNFAKTNKANTFTENQKIKGATLEFENASPSDFPAGKIEVNNADAKFDITAFYDMLIESTHGHIDIVTDSAHNVRINNTIIPKNVELQTKLVSGTNIKTINGQSILGSGNIEIEGGGAVDSVNGKTGEVVLNASDIYAQNAQTIQRNLERLDERIDEIDERKGTSAWTVNADELCADDFDDFVDDMIAVYEQDPSSIKIVRPNGDDVTAEFFNGQLYNKCLNNQIDSKEVVGVNEEIDLSGEHYFLCEYSVTEEVLNFVLVKVGSDNEEDELDIQNGTTLYTATGFKDYWFEIKSLNKAIAFDADSPNLNAYARKDTTNTFTQDQTFNEKAKFVGTATYSIYANEWGELVFNVNGADIFNLTGAVFKPTGNNNRDLGASGQAWKDAYIYEHIYLGARTITENSFGSTTTESSSTTYNGALTSNQEKVFTQPLTSLTITSLTQASGDDLPRYECSFVVGANMTITLPSGVVWKMGTPTLVEGDSWTLYIKGGFAYLC